MNSNSGAILGLVLLAGTLAAISARAEDAPHSCEVPDYLLSSESSLPKVAESVKAGHPLDILVIGSRSSTIISSESSAYPARLQAALKEKLPQITVNLSLELQVKKTAEEANGGFAKLVGAKKPTLVIWQTGTVDAMRSVDPDDFRAAIDQGVVALQNAGADVVLMNMQYSPRTETIISLPPYLIICAWSRSSTTSRCSTALPSCINGTMPEISTSLARRMASSLRSAFMIASAVPCRNSCSTPLISGRPSRIEDLGLMSFVRPFCRNASLAAAALAALMLLTPAAILPARAQAAPTVQRATVSEVAKADAAGPGRP